MNGIIAYNLASKVKKSVKTLSTQVILKGSTEAYVPTSDYEPATKKYIDDIAKYGIHTELGRTVVYEAVSGAGTTEFFESGSVAKKDRITITTVANSFEYKVEVNDNVYTYTSDADATIGEIRDALETLIDGDSEVTCVHDGDELVVQGSVTNTYYSLRVGENLSYVNEVVANDGSKYIVGAITVFVNGEAIGFDQFTATDTNKIVFNTGLNDQDKVMLVAYGGESVIGSTSGAGSISAYTKAECDSTFDTITNVDIKIEASAALTKAYAVAMAIAL